MRRRRGTSGLVAATLAMASAANANGRFPRAERLIENPSNADELRVAGTYGILTTSDRGRSWYHICEASFALQAGYLGDPILDVMPDETWLVGVQATLNASYDRGCQWTPVLGGGDTYVFDDAVARSEPSTVVGLLGTYENGGIVYTLRRSIDNGKTWGAPTPLVGIDIAYTVDIDPRDASHLFVSGLANNVGQLLASTDAGATWTAHAIANTSLDEPPYIAGLHPADANRVFVRTDSWVMIDGSLTANDALLYSDDAGASWKELFRGTAKLLGFALSPDGSTVLIGYGDPQPGGGQVVSGPFGIFKASTDAFSFEPVFDGRVGCLAWTENGVYVCGSQSFDGFELAFSKTADIGPDGGAFEPLLELGRVKGPLACDAGTSGAACVATWDFACATFGACKDAGPAGTNDAGSNAADAGRDRDVGTTDVAGGAGCGCRTARPDVTSPSRWVALWAAVGLWRVARRRRALIQ
jgi:hypothetical protein